jgi:N-acetylneuraminic acid mutarotase
MTLSQIIWSDPRQHLGRAAISNETISKDSLLHKSTQAQEFTVKPSRLISVVSASVMAVAAIAFFLASVYNPIAQAASGIEPRDGTYFNFGTTTTQDIITTPATSHVVSGTVKDATAGWPLYASLNISGYPASTIWNDPVTGFYSVTLAEGITYTFNVDAWAGGYNSVARTVAPLTDNRTQNFTLTVNSATCSAPGYIPPNLQDFEVSNGGYIADGTNLWAWGAPTSGPGNAYSGGKVWATNLSGNYHSNENAYLTSPNIDLSAYAGQTLTLSWWQWLWTESGADYASVEVSNNGGGTWTVVYGPASGDVNTDDWAQHVATLDSSYAVSNFRVRFHFTSDTGGAAPGWYVDDVAVSAKPCTLLPGGLVVGNVYDANTNAPLANATVRNDRRQAAGTAVTIDPAVDDSFYTLFSLVGAHLFTATKTRYGNVVSTTNVIPGSAVRLNHYLPAGLLAYEPPGLEATLEKGMSTTLVFTLTNSGTLSAAFGLREQNGDHPNLLLADQGAPLKRIPDEFFSGPLVGHYSTMQRLNTEQPNALDALPWASIASYPFPVTDNTADEWDGLIYSVGGFDGHNNLNTGYVYHPNSNTWSPIAPMSARRGKPAAAFIDGRLYVFGGWDNAGNSVSTLEIYDPGSDSWTTGASAPVALGASTGVALGGQFYVIGGQYNYNLPCTGPDSSCGTDVFLAGVYRYDPKVNSWTAVAPYPVPVSWNACGAIQGLIYCAGGLNTSVELNSTYMYDPSSNAWTQLINMPQTQWAMGYTVANGQLFVSGGITGGSETNAGFSYDPVANQWTPIANSNFAVYRGASACGFYKIGGSIGSNSPASIAEVYPELNSCAPDVPWLKEDPVTGTIASLKSQVITITFDTDVLNIKQPDTYYAQLLIQEDTPYPLTNVPVTLTIDPTADMGWVEGAVTDAQTGLPLTATIELQGVYSTTAQSTYKIWATAGAYSMTVGAVGYVTQTVGVNITAQQGLTQNLALVPNRVFLPIVLR